MKKLLSIVLAVVMMATLVVSASAAETNLLVNVESNNAEKATVTQDGNSWVIDVKAPVDAQNNGFGASIAPKLEGVNVDKDNGGTGFIHMDIVAEVPFRLTMNDSNNGAWISFGGEFFNAMTPEGFAFSNPDAPKIDELLVDGKEFFPAGTYKCSIYLGGVYTWKAKEDPTKWDASKANLTAFYLEGQKAGKITVNQFTLTDAAEYSSEVGETPSGDNNDQTTGGDSNTNTATTTTKAQTTTTVKKPAATTGDSAKTGDVSNAILFVVVAAAAAGVVTVSAVSKKSKAR